jgi:O-antigen ligase
MIRNRLPAPRLADMIPGALLSVLGVSYGLAVVALFASGQLTLSWAGLILGMPFAFALAVLRPEWMILAIVLLPPSVTSPISSKLLIAVMLATLFGFFLNGGLRLTFDTGVYPLVGIIALALVLKADTSGLATATADGMLRTIIYYALLMLVAFHTAASGRVQVDTVVDAVLLGLVIAAVLQPFVSDVQSFDSISRHPFSGHFAYLAVMGFGLTYVRLSLSSSVGRPRSAFDRFLVPVFLFLTVVSYSRVVWMAGLVVFALVSKWTGRKTFWVVSSLVLVLALTVPIVGERVIPGASTDVADPQTLARITTGRSILWQKLWARAVEALPMGQGWGYIPSLNSQEIFGFEGVFSSGGTRFVYPHNDFLYLFVDLGILGIGLLAAYWLLLLRRIRGLSRSRSEPVRYAARLLVPIILVMFLIQLFANALSIRFVAEKFFIAAGLIFGLHVVARERPPSLRGHGTSPIEMTSYSRLPERNGW